MCDEYDALMLGSSIKYFDEPSAVNDIWKARGLSTHAYILSKRGMAKFLAAADFLKPILSTLRTTFYNVLSGNTSIATPAKR